MTKVRKVKRRKTYNHNRNRKRLRNKMCKLPNIACDEIKKAWERNKSTKSNLRHMGLAYDANAALKIPNVAAGMVKKAKAITSDDLPTTESKPQVGKRVPRKIEVANALEADAKAPRERMFRLPNNEVQFATYMMDKYGDDYEAMARDKKNYYQHTWKQIRAKIKRFKGIPEQYAEYLVKKGEIVLDDPTPLKIKTK